MCGFAGFAGFGSFDYEQVCSAMIDTLVHRGPDDRGVWVDKEQGIALGHRRLSIQDLSPLGHQPMVSASSRYIIVYNGEVYNFKVIQHLLEKEGCRFRGHSDTEIILAAIEKWEIEGALKKFVGMFAFALWDKKDGMLTLARDRFGEKPLYFGWQGSSFLFGSELKALRKHPAWATEVDRNSLTLLMRHNYIPAPHTIFKGIQKLMPGTYLQFSRQSPVGEIPEAVEYWSVKTIAESSQKQLFESSDEEVTNQLESLLTQSIEEKMIADVSLGAFLSGGIDSSVVTALMQKSSASPIRTFSIGFHEQGYNEAEYAKAVAQHLNTEHTELYVSSEQALQVVPHLASLYDEPFADSSQIPTYLVSAMTKKHVTVALSGDGGDELFCGYQRYFTCEQGWQKLSKIPYKLRHLVASGIPVLSPSTWDKFGGIIAPVIPQLKERTGDRLLKAAELLKVPSANQLYKEMVSYWKEPSSLVLGGIEPPSAFTDPSRGIEVEDLKQRLMFLDTVSYLPDDILTKVDRASMSVSLETRVPFLDHRIVEFASRVPMHQKARDGEGKWILKQVLYKHIPQSLIERPKMGFGIPLDKWLRTSLRDWAEALLDEKRLRDEGFFCVEDVRQKWEEHLAGERNWQAHLWGILMFQAWLEEWEEVEL